MIRLLLSYGALWDIECRREAMQRADLEALHNLVRNDPDRMLLEYYLYETEHVRHPNAIEAEMRLKRAVRAGNVFVD